MEFLTDSIKQLISNYLPEKRQREPQTRHQQKIRIIKSQSLNTTSFFFPGSNEVEKTIDSLTNLPSNNILELKSRLDLITDSIIYTKKKIRKLDPEGVKTSHVPENGFYESHKKKYWQLFANKPVSIKQVELYLKLVPFPKSMSYTSVSFYQTISQYFFAESDLGDYKESLRESNLSSLLDNSYILIPIREVGWNLIVINNEHKTLEFYSSDPQIDYRIPCERVEKVLVELEKAENYDWEIIKTPEHENLADSGIFMLTFIKDLALNHPFTVMSQEISAIRGKISSELKQNTIFS